MTISNISRNMEIVSFFQKIRNTVFLKMIDESPALISENTGFPAWSLNNYSVYNNKTSSKKDQGSWITVVIRALWIRLPKQHCYWSQQINFKTSERTQKLLIFPQKVIEKLLSLVKRDEVFIFECFEQQKENYLLQERGNETKKNSGTITPWKRHPVTF